MKYIVRYDNFNESKGISDSCEKVLYKVWNLIESDILSYNNSEVTYDINETDFKVSGLGIKYSINKSDNRICYGIVELNNSKIINDKLIDSKINLKIDVDVFDDEFIYYIKSVLLHELLHLFQHYNILKGNKFRPESFSIGSIIPQLRNIIKTKYGNYILDILYYSLPHELSAQIHQYYLYKLNDKEYKKIEQIIKLLNNFKPITLSIEENNDISYIKKHILNSIKFYTNNKKYLSDINKSIWNIKDNDLFLNKFMDIINKRIEWVNKKIILIDKNISDQSKIRYDETISLPTNWDDNEYHYIKDVYDFISTNLIGCP